MLNSNQHPLGVPKSSYQHPLGDANKAFSIKKRGAVKEHFIHFTERRRPSQKQKLGRYRLGARDAIALKKLVPCWILKVFHQQSMLAVCASLRARLQDRDRGDFSCIQESGCSAAVYYNLENLRDWLQSVFISLQSWNLEVCFQKRIYL